MNRETHAQVSATLVPQLIKDLAEPGASADAAFFHLTETLVVAGTWLPTSAPAAELLLALLNRPDADPVPCALRLLADVAAAGHLWFFSPAAPEQRKRDAVGQHTLALAQQALPLHPERYQPLSTVAPSSDSVTLAMLRVDTPLT